MAIRIRIKQARIKAGSGQMLPVGSEHVVDKVPDGWKHFVDIIGEVEQPSAKKVAVTNPAKQETVKPDDTGNKGPSDSKDPGKDADPASTKTEKA